MTNTPFFTATELASRLQVDVSSLNAATATLLCTLASDCVRDDLRQQVDAVANDTVTLYGDGGEILVLPERPVTAVASVTLAGSSIPLFDWRANGALYRVLYPGSQWSPELIWPWPYGVAATVVYSHGYATVPSTIKAVALELAASTYSNDEFLSSKTVDDVSEAFLSLTLTPWQRSALDVYRKVDM